MTDRTATTIDCISEFILDFLLPFFIAGAGGDDELGRAAILELAEAYDAVTAMELEVVGRLLGFSVVAMDNLRLSMKPDMSDTKVLRYRSNAVALSRAGEQCRKVLEVMQRNRKPVVKPMAVAVAPVAGPPCAEPACAAKAAPPGLVTQAAPLPVVAQTAPPKMAENWSRPRTMETPAAHSDKPPIFARGIEAAKQEARMLLEAFAKTGAAAMFPGIPDPAMVVDKAVRQAFMEARHTAAA
jgi:hypothetical protein